MKIWIVDAFTDRVFTGNPAAVVPLERWLPDATLQAVAAENKLSETAFVVPTGLKGNYQLRWFTPATEVPLCGHATLAAGAVLLSEVAPDLEVVVFDTHAGALIVRGTPEGYTLDLPRRVRTAWEVPADIAAALGDPEIVEGFVGEYANVVLETEEAVRSLKPDFAALNRLVRGPRQGCITVTAPADEGKPYDFVSRFFAPGVGINEDPVTGSSFADLAPYWCDRFDLESVVGFQASKRGGFTRAIQTLSSVRLFGQVAVYLRGELDGSIARLHNRVSEAPEAPKRKRRRSRKEQALPAIFDEPMLPGLEAAPPPPVSHPVPPEAEEPPAPRITVTGDN
ncbi:MAG: PhzF family phenazine biosynthesis protein [Hyphomonadaceae bacterium]|nr:PhzF family phenazine biosynthesis protein [Hyphomonadaceae bacterium]